MNTSPSKRLLTISERLYRLLLLAYPAEFRRAYRREMIQTFRDCCREAQQRGQWSMLRLWGLLLYDLVTTAFTEHVRTCIALFKRMFLNTTDTLLATEGSTALVTQFHLNVAQRSDIGRQREVNEDSMISILPEDPQVMAKKGALFVVADGLGGHTYGDIASEMAVNTVRDAYYADANDDVDASLLQAMQRANAAIYQANQSQNPPPEKDKIMGTTCVAAVLIADTVHVANVGDSRAYIVRGDQVIQISQDHSMVADQMRAGLLTPDQAREHPQRNMIYRCFGEKADVEVDLFSEAVQEGDLLVLCTDGLSNLVSDEELQKIVQQFGPQESVYHLVDRANEQGGPDNITAIVVRVSLEDSAGMQKG